MNTFIKYPFGVADSQAPAYAATIAATINNTETVITPDTLTGAATLNLTINSEMPVGANLTVIATADGTNRVLTFGTGMSGAAYTVTASKTVALSFKYTGAKFVNTAVIQLN